jgi:hypothetical protein
MPKGFTVPRSPLGAAALTPPPPWHYAGDVLAVEFWNDPEAAADMLPRGIALDATDPGHSVALFVDCQFTAQDDEYLDPARYQYRQFLVLLDARHQEAGISWCPYVYTDNDASLARGWIQGYPEKIGAVHQTRTFAATNAASAPLLSNSRFAASVSAHGQQLARAQITLQEKVDQLAGVLDRPIVSRRYFPQLSAGLHDKPAVDELVRCVMDDLVITNIWVGGGALIFPETYGEELEILGPVKVGRGFRFSFSCSISDNEVLTDASGGSPRR